MKLRYLFLAIEKILKIFKPLIVKILSTQFFILILFFATLLSACNKENIDITTLQDREGDTCTHFAFDVVNVGDTHNAYIIAAYSNLDFSDTVDLENRIYTEFMHFSYEPYDLGVWTHEEYWVLTRNLIDSLKFYEFNLKAWENRPISPHVYSYVQKIITDIEGMETVAEFSTLMDNLKDTVDSDETLSCLDWDIINASISLAKSSAYLWSNEEDGGYGLIEKMISDGYPFDQGKLMCCEWIKNIVKKAVIGDVAGAATYFTGVGITGLIVASSVPPTAAALLVGAGVSAGLGSVLGAIWK